jgi:geranylgeranylglycerol-phosphate geranylgeranyltransferase
VNPLVRLFRPVNAIMAVLGTFISSLVAIGLSVEFHLLIISIAAIVVFLVLSGGNIMNDVLDVESDKINHPERPIPSGHISRRFATYLFISCYLLAVILASIFLPFYGVIISLLAIALLVYYETKGKYQGLPGNLTVSLLIGLIFLFGGVIFNEVSRTILLFFLATFSNASRELIKDVQDMNGDVDRKTFPRTYGRNAALNLSSVFIIITLGFSVLPYYFKIFGVYYLISVLFCDFFFLVTFFSQYRSAKEGQQFSKISMILGLISFTIGGLT